MLSNIIQGNTTEAIVFGPIVLAADHITGATGKSLTVTISKNGGAFATPAGAITEVGNGYYKIAPNASDADTVGTLVVHATGSGCDPFDDELDVIAAGQQASYIAPASSFTVADLLAIMELLDNELETGSGEDDEAAAIKALTEAQHHFEMVAASMPRVLGQAVTLTTTANQETSIWPTYMLRLDAIWRLDSNGAPIAKLEDVGSVGGHVPSLPWPLQITLQPGLGAPIGYFADSTNFYWLVKPDASYTIRLYGFVEQAEFVSRSSPFNYPGRVKLPLAQFANKILNIGVGDGNDQYFDNLATQMFRPLLRQLRKFDRSGPKTKIYSQIHTT